MFPDDRVLVAVMNRPHDFEIARDQHWYRLPHRAADRGPAFEYVAFYFTAAFGEQKWAVHYFARNLGHELVTRRDLLPEELGHPRADQPYVKLQLGPLQKREPPIISLRWRRVTFIHTTWDRFEAAEELNDLLVGGEEFVDRLYHALRDDGLAPERNYPVREMGVEYEAALALICREGIVGIDVQRAASPQAGGALILAPEQVASDLAGCLDTIRGEVAQRGGVLLGRRP